MNEELFLIELEKGKSLLVLADRRCISASMKHMYKFIHQISSIINIDETNAIAKSSDDTESALYITKLFCSAMTEGLEFSLVEISSIDFSKFDHIGGVCISNDTKNAYYSIPYNGNTYCLFV